MAKPMSIHVFMNFYKYGHTSVHGPTNVNISLADCAPFFTMYVPSHSIGRDVIKCIWKNGGRSRGGGGTQQGCAKFMVRRPPRDQPPWGSQLWVSSKAAGLHTKDLHATAASLI